jgi:hypothetical protein
LEQGTQRSKRAEVGECLTVGWAAYLVAGAVAVAVVAMVFRQVRKRGKAEGQLELAAQQGGRKDAAAEIIAEPTGDAGSWSDKLHKNDSD